MVVRILGEGQYRVTGPLLEELDRADNQILEAIERGDEAAFRSALERVVSLVRQGQALADAELVESDLILPAPDTTLREAQELFADYPWDLVS